MGGRFPHCDAACARADILYVGQGKPRDGRFDGRRAWLGRGGVWAGTGQFSAGLVVIQAHWL